MAQSLRIAIEDIRRKIQAGSYRNEENVRLSLVARILQSLGWNIWDPLEVYSEFAIGTIDKNIKRSGIALLNGNRHLVFIEVKAIDKTLNKSIEQVKRYNEDFIAPISILTNGREWWFYYNYSHRKFNNRMFVTLDLMKDNIGSLETMFIKYMSIEESLNGNAVGAARQLLNRTDRYKKIESLIPEAVQISVSHGTKSPVDCLLELARKNGINVELHECIIIYNEWQNNRVKPDPPNKPEEPVKPIGPKSQGDIYGKTKLRGFKFLDKHYNVKNWAALLPELSNVLANRHTNFEAIVLSRSFGNRNHFDLTPTELRKGVLVLGTRVYVNCHGAPDAQVVRAHKLLREFGYTENDIYFDSEKPSSDEPHQPLKKEVISKFEKISKDVLIREIVLALQSLGGEARKNQVHKIIERKYSNVFSSEYYKKRVQNGDYKWQNEIDWARNAAKEQGYIEDPKTTFVRKGFWSLTEKGEQYE